MDQAMKINQLRQIMTNITPKPKEVKPVASYRFDIFKGQMGTDEKIKKVRSVGSAYLKDGQRTYIVNLKTFLNEKFFLLPNSKPENKFDFVILTREPAQNISRKYFWNNVGEGIFLEGLNHGLMKLSWDVLANDLYM